MRLKFKAVKKSLTLLLALMIAAIGVTAIAGCSSGPEPAAGSAASGSGTTTAVQDIRIGRVGSATGAIDAAVANGDFKKEGLNVELTVFKGGTESIAALASGDLDFAIGSYEHVLRQRENGLNVKAYALINNSVGYDLVVKSDSSYQTLADLKGQALGVTTVGGVVDTALRRGLTEAGLDPDNDVQIIGVGTGASALAAVESGNVAASMVADPTLADVVDSGEYRIIYTPEYETAGRVLIGNDDWVKEHPDALRKFLEITKSEIVAINADPEKFVAPFQPDFPGVSDKVILISIKNYLSHEPVDQKITQQQTEVVIQEQLDLGAIKNPVPFSEGVDLSYLPK